MSKKGAVGPSDFIYTALCQDEFGLKIKRLHSAYDSCYQKVGIYTTVNQGDKPLYLNRSGLDNTTNN